MKRTVAFTLLLSCIFACLSFAGCDLFEKPELEKVTPDPDMGPAYELRFTSNGDGTCYVSEIATRPNIAEPYTVEIPETSPDGDRVVAVDPISALYDTAVRNVPYMILVEDFEVICTIAKQNGMSDFDYTRLTAYFLKLSTEGLDEREKAELIEVFPYTEFADIYVSDQRLSDDDMVKLSRYLIRYAGFGEDDRYKADQRLGQIIEEHGQGNALDLSHNYTAFMEKLVLPASVTLVNLPTVAFKEVTYAGTLAEWEAGSFDLNSLLGTRIVCSDGETTYREQYVIQQDGSIAFATDLAQNVTVKLPDTRHGQPYTYVYLTLGCSAESDKQLMFAEEYEALLTEMEQQGKADKAQKFRSAMAIMRIGPVEYVIVNNAKTITNLLSLPEDYFIKATARVCEKTRVTENMTTPNSKYFTALELPATLQTLHVSVESFENIYLTDIYYPGTLEQWAQVVVLNYNQIPYDLSAITVHCSDGDVPFSYVSQ